MDNTRSRNWCFRLNNYTDDEYVLIKNIECKYIVVGKEVGESGTPHLQGYVHFANAKAFTAVQKLIKRAHLEVMRGTALEASTYCKKDGVFFENGDHPKTAAYGGKMEQDRWAVAKSQAYESGDCEDPMISFLHYKACKNQLNKRLKLQVLPDTTERMRWYWGESGTGKSRAARTEFPNAYLKMCNKWWNGYLDQDVAIIDDIDPSHEVWIGAFLKEWTDHYRFQAETKGGTRVIRPKIIVVTSQYSIEQIFKDPETVTALERRFTMKHFKETLYGFFPSKSLK